MKLQWRWNWNVTKIPAAIQDKLEYVRDFKDRSHPLAFVGRHEEMKFLRQLVDRVRRTPAGLAQPKGALRLIHGIPGTGKSALMDEFVRRIEGPPPRLDLQAAAKADDGAPAQTPPPPPVLCVELDETHLALAPLQLVRSITKNVVESQAQWQLAQFPKTQIDGKVVWNAVSRWLLRGASWDTVRDSSHGLAEVSPLKDCLVTYADSVWPPGITIVLVIDEVQNLRTQDENTKGNMRCLFAGKHGVRMPVLCFGLSNSGKVLDDLGLSRPATQSDHQIGYLETGEGRMVIEKTMREIGLDIGNEGWRDYLRSIGMTKEKWEAWRTDMTGVLTENSADFPQHLAVAHIALCEGVLNMKQDDAFDDALRDTIVANHIELKQNYYEVQLGSSGVENHQVAMGAICDLFGRTGGAPMHRMDALSLLKIGDDEGVALTDEKAKQVLHEALKKGLFAERKRRPKQSKSYILPPPIPSLQTYLAECFHTELHASQAGHRQHVLAMRSFLNKADPTHNADEEITAELEEEGSLDP